MTQAARDALVQLQGLVSENSEPLHSTLANFSTFSAALARNSDRLDGIIAGLERLTGGGASSRKPNRLRSDSSARFPSPREDAVSSIQHSRATAVLMFDTQKILVRPSGTEGPTFSMRNGATTFRSFCKPGSFRASKMPICCVPLPSRSRA